MKPDAPVTRTRRSRRHRYPAPLRTMNPSVPRPMAACRMRPGTIERVLHARRPKTRPATPRSASSERGGRNAGGSRVSSGRGRGRRSAVGPLPSLSAVGAKGKRRKPRKKNSQGKIVEEEVGRRNGRGRGRIPASRTLADEVARIGIEGSQIGRGRAQSADQRGDGHENPEERRAQETRLEDETEVDRPFPEGGGRIAGAAPRRRKDREKRAQ